MKPLPLDAARGVALREAIDFGDRQPVEVSWNRLLQRAGCDAKAERRLRIAACEQPVDEARGEAVAAAYAIHHAHIVVLALDEAPCLLIPQHRAPSVVA